MVRVFERSQQESGKRPPRTPVLYFADCLHRIGLPFDLSLGIAVLSAAVATIGAIVALGVLIFHALS